MPLKIFRKLPHYFFSQKIKDIEFIESEKTHHVNEHVEFEWIYSEEAEE
jgi:hypothetical protein